MFLVQLVFKIPRGFVTERAGASHAVVVFFDVVEKVLAGFSAPRLAAAGFGQSHAFALVGGVEAFHDRVVLRMAAAAQARCPARRFPLSAPVSARGWHAAIALGQQALAGSAGWDRPLERARGQAGGPGLSGGPAHPAPTPQLQPHRRIQPAFAGPHAGQIGDPRLVWPGGRGPLGQPVRRTRLSGVAVGGLRPKAAGAQAAPPGGFQQARKALDALWVASFRQCVLEARRAVAAFVWRRHRGDLLAQPGVAWRAGAGRGLGPTPETRSASLQRRRRVGSRKVRPAGLRWLRGVARRFGAEAQRFFRMSRGSLTRASSRRRARCSASKGSRSGRAAPSSRAFQSLRRGELIPSSAAICGPGFPGLRQCATACCLNSSPSRLVWGEAVVTRLGIRGSVVACCVSVLLLLFLGASLVAPPLHKVPIKPG